MVSTLSSVGSAPMAARWVMAVSRPRQAVPSASATSSSMPGCRSVRSTVVRVSISRGEQFRSISLRPRSTAAAAEVTRGLLAAHRKGAGLIVVSHDPALIAAIGREYRPGAG